MKDDSPWAMLGLDPGASSEEIRSRYTALVKRHPPDRDPDVFQAIRDAYDRLKDPRTLARERLFGPPPVRNLDELEAALGPFPRRPAGRKAWIEALRELTR